MGFLSTYNVISSIYQATILCPGCGNEDTTMAGTWGLFSGEVANCALCDLIFVSNEHMIAINFKD